MAEKEKKPASNVTQFEAWRRRNEERKEEDEHHREPPEHSAKIIAVVAANSDWVSLFVGEANDGTEFMFESPIALWVLCEDRDDPTHRWVTSISPHWEDDLTLDLDTSNHSGYRFVGDASRMNDIDV